MPSTFFDVVGALSEPYARDPKSYDDDISLACAIITPLPLLWHKHMHYALGHHAYSRNSTGRGVTTNTCT